MHKRIALIVFFILLCLMLFYGAYRAYRHQEARPAVSPTAALLLAIPWQRRRRPALTSEPPA
ncbi:hypothetical protein [Dyella acidiphila]|uniref:Uncharacterized protein n=1 Tax=Dyella acidiphila TaxID=2775866 RepID=A0ABR9GCU1_9GAMM|nr:hypothetical protein [Dyella acidiphila]MBE1161840.1 hypothetical protein [Dyella acidiphila]